MPHKKGEMVSDRRYLVFALVLNERLRSVVAQAALVKVWRFLLFVVGFFPCSVRSTRVGGSADG